MYKQIETDNPFVDGKGRQINPIATLADEYGGRVQVTEDDHCIRCFLARNLPKQEGETYYEPISYLFPELFEFLKTLETPKHA